MLRAGQVFQVGTVGEEQQRLGVVGLVEAALSEQRAVEAARLRESEQLGHHRPAPARSRRPRPSPGRCRVPPPARCRRPTPTSAAGRRWPRPRASARPGRSGATAAPCSGRDDEVLRAVDRDRHPGPVLRRQAARSSAPRSCRACTGRRRSPNRSCRRARSPPSRRSRSAPPSPTAPTSAACRPARRTARRGSRSGCVTTTRATTNSLTRSYGRFGPVHGCAAGSASRRCARVVVAAVTPAPHLGQRCHRDRARPSAGTAGRPRAGGPARRAPRRGRRRRAATARCATSASGRSRAR